MRAVWKWILGVVLVLVVIAGLAATAFFWHGGWATVSYREMPMPHGRSWNNGPMMRGDDLPWQQGPMMRVERGFRPFGGLFFLGRLLHWAFFGALLYGAYWLGRRNARVVIDPRSAAVPPAAPVQTTPPDPNPPASE
jgi:hypothetical protein